MKPELMKNRLLQLVLLTLMVGRTLAGYYFCPEEGQRHVIEISELLEQSVVLVPQFSPASTIEPMQCSWKITVTRMTTSRQILLLGDQSQPSGLQLLTQGSSELQFQLHQPGSLHRREPVFPGMMKVIALTDRETIHVSLKQNVKVHGLTSRSPVNLRIMIPRPGFCSRDMLSFNGSCHAISPLPSNVTVSMSNIRGDAQLASFISMSQVNSFIAANEARRDVHPFRRALELSQAVRLGMFYSATDATILSVVRNESGCVLQAVERPEEMLATAAPVTGACGSLRVDESGRAVMEFGDCSKPMLSLMSFPETASSTTAVTECSSDDLAELVKQLEREYLNSTVTSKNPGSHPPGVLVSQTTTDPGADVERSPLPAAVWIGVTLGVSILAVAAVVVPLLAVRRRRFLLRMSLQVKRRRMKEEPVYLCDLTAPSVFNMAEPGAGVHGNFYTEMQPLTEPAGISETDRDDPEARGLLPHATSSHSVPSEGLYENCSAPGPQFEGHEKNVL